MGWFWAAADPAAPEDPIDRIHTHTPPKNQQFTGLFWSVPLDAVSASRVSRQAASECPRAKPPAGASKCPVDHTKLMKKSSQPSTASDASQQGCPRKATGAAAAAAPVDEASSHGLNPMNQMPELNQLRVPGQKIDLPTQRTVSSIPKGNESGSGNWEYPSPQQMLNAMVRKSGPEEIPEDAVESMVDVHNFLNEGVWQEVLQWEAPYTAESKVQPRLLKFLGRSEDMTPRAAFHQLLGKIYPSKYGVPPPFDRHDWTVLRWSSNKHDWEPVKYVIDFYEAPDDGDMPVFNVDVRPAFDSYQNIRDRIYKSAGPIWNKAMGYE